MEAFAKFGERRSCTTPSCAEPTGQIFGGARTQGNLPGDNGTAARFFYCAKASTKERGGCDHPTMKPLALMRHLCKLVTPEDGTILDPFAGTGTTGLAACLEGFKAILIEREAEYVKWIERRLAQYIK